MRVTFIGHSCFLLEGEGRGGPRPSTGGQVGGQAGRRVITDPYEHGAYGGAVRYLPVDDHADVVTVSHAHPDHSFASGIPGGPEVVTTAGGRLARGVEILGVPAFHDGQRGAQRGNVVLFRVVLEGMAVVHLGDLGHPLDEATAKALSPVDILLLPVGGTFTLGPREAWEAALALAPRLVIPMHYKTAGVDFPIAPVEDFLRRKEGVTRSTCSSVDVASGEVPSGILVLAPRNLP